jgi:hypothetical protein
MMRTAGSILVGVALALVLGACASWNVDVHKLQLGMEPEAVRDAIGDPFTIRAAKVYEGEQIYAEVWEYLPPWFTWTPKTYWVYFENGKVVQWGEPGDFTGKTVPAILEYNPNKSAR